ncbi:MAG: spondin domain-containing protein [Planctomycetota bacterium]
MRSIIAIGSAFAVSTAASAQVQQVRVTVENLAADNGVAFAPLRVGFHSGVFDAFNNGEAAFLLGESSIADAPIVSVAEGGSGSTWFPAFEAADPNATLGSVLPDPAGPLTPGGTGSATFDIDTDINQFFTFAAMVIPSNDLFIGNDSPTGLRLFDDNGNLLITEIFQTGAQIWDAGSEVADPSAAAFVVGGNNGARVDQNGVVAFDFSELAAFDGVETPAGYTYDNSLLAADTTIYRISFEIVPTPATASLFGLAAVAAVRRRRS